MFPNFTAICVNELEQFVEHDRCHILNLNFVLCFSCMSCWNMAAKTRLLAPTMALRTGMSPLPTSKLKSAVTLLSKRAAKSAVKRLCLVDRLFIWAGTHTWSTVGRGHSTVDAQRVVGKYIDVRIFQLQVTNESVKSHTQF